MRTAAKAIRSHREAAKNRRAIYRAIDNASTPSMRDELIVMAQRAHALSR